MKTNDLKELRNSTEKAIEKKIAELEGELAEKSLKLKRQDLKNPREPKMLKRSIAQLKTILKEKQLFETKEKVTK